MCWAGFIDIRLASSCSSLHLQVSFCLKPFGSTKSLKLILNLQRRVNSLSSQNKEGILPVATLSIALYVLRRSMSASDVAPEVTILSSAL